MDEFCPRCGVQRVATYRYCASCAFDFGELAPESPATLTSPPVATPSTPGPPVQVPIPATPTAVEPRGSALLPRLLLVAVVVVLVAGAAAFVMTARPAAAPGSAGRPTPTPSAAPKVVSSQCASALGPFVASLEDLDSRLGVGLNFSAYSDKVGGIKVQYDKLKPDELDAGCITLVGKPGEDALNKYVAAYNVWNDCIGRTGCTNDSIKSTLQGDWSSATTLIAQIKQSMP